MKKDALIHTEEKHSATSHSNILLTSKRISRGTLQLQSVKVNTKQHNQATLRSTGGRILEKKPSIAINVNTKQDNQAP